MTHDEHFKKKALKNLHDLKKAKATFDKDVAADKAIMKHLHKESTMMKHE